MTSYWSPPTTLSERGRYSERGGGGVVPLQVTDYLGKTEYRPITTNLLDSERQNAAERHRDERHQTCVRCGGR